MKDQRTSQESEIVMSFLSPASPLESFELGPVFCPDAQMTFFFFRSEKKNCCWKSLNITLWQKTKDQTYFLREIVTMEKENAPLKIWGLQGPDSKCFPGGHGLRCSPFLNSQRLKIGSYGPDTAHRTSLAFPFQSFTHPILQMSQPRLHNLPKVHSLKVTEPYFDQVWIQEPTRSHLCQGYST